MLALPLSAGTHSITLTYRNPAFVLGLRISLACGAAFAAVLLTCCREEISPKPGKFARGHRRQKK